MIRDRSAAERGKTLKKTTSPHFDIDVLSRLVNSPVAINVPLLDQTTCNLAPVPTLMSITILPDIPL